MLDFDPKNFQCDIESKSLFVPVGAEVPMPVHQHQIYTTLRDENRVLAAEIVFYTDKVKQHRTRKNRTPKAGDLRSVRNLSLDY